MGSIPSQVRACAILLSILLLPAVARAAVPDAMRVQGTLLTSSGAPVNGTHDLTFSLWDTASGGTQQWATIKSGVVVQGGVFEVELTGVPTAPFRTLPALWLETRVGTEAPLPRQRFDSTAFAVKAGLADEASALLCTGCVGASHLGAGAVTSVKLADGAITTAKLADAAVTADKAAFNYAASATKGGAAANLACTGCVDATELAQKYAGSDTAGGPASDVACTDCIGAAEVAFPWAASVTEGGPAAGLACTGCVGLTDLDVPALDARYLRLSGGTLTGNVTTTGTIEAAAFAGDGSQLTGLPSGVAPGTCTAGTVVTGVASDGTLICSKLCAVSNFVGSVSDGSTSAGVDLTYQYSPLGTGVGYIKASWPAQTEVIGYQVAVGTASGATNVKDFVDVPSTSATITGLTLQGAWTDTTYYVTVRGVCEGGLPTGSKTSNGVRIAEGATWNGDASALRAPDALGGHSVNWPQGGITSVYGEHWFETVAIASSTTVHVQSWGKVQGAGESISASAAAVQSPRDGWLNVYANTITIDGTITSSGRGYGGGGGGGGGSGSVARRGRGGSNGLGGAGGDGESGSGGGGGGSPGGPGGWGANGNGGAGNIFGGGSGSTTCSGTAGRAGGDGPTGDIGGPGGNVPSNAHTGGAGGQGEFVAGGAHGVNGCDSRSGGGGGGYGGGGSGGTQWAGPGVDAAGGGGGGTGGVGGGETPHGGAGAGPYGGGAGNAPGGNGGAGGYRGSSGNGDSTTGREQFLGSGGGGAGAATQEAGGGGGAAGGGWLTLFATDKLTIGSTGKVLANGAGGAGGSRDFGGNFTAGTGGAGAGGSVLLEARTVEVVGAIGQRVSARGGGGSTGNGGTIKLFYNVWTGAKPTGSNAGRIYDAGGGSYADR